MFESLENRQFMSATSFTPSVPIPPPVKAPTATKVTLVHEPKHAKDVRPAPKPAPKPQCPINPILHNVGCPL
jgi:hypothetical protein